jgi:membrane fusion protein (multidrug efflux system)
MLTSTSQILEPVAEGPGATASDHKPALRSSGRSRPRNDGRPARGALGRLALPALSLLVTAGLVGVAITRWDTWQGGSGIQATDNAYVRAEMTRLASRVAGAVQSVAVRDFQRVKAGDLLVEIDPADYAAQAAQIEASVAGAQAALDNLGNQTALQHATISQAEAQNASAVAREIEARQERQRQQALLQSTFGTRQKVEQATAQHMTATGDLRASEAFVEAQKRQLDILASTQKQRLADLQAAQASLAAARLKLGYTRIVAPFDGVVGERQVQQGDYVNVGSNLITVVPLPEVYVVANYKETQLTYVADGQAVDVTVDTFPGETLHGRVERLSPASGSQFALLPPDNATGNFTKVVQRVPVRIDLDPRQPLIARLRPGMSVTTRIHTEMSTETQAQP